MESAGEQIATEIRRIFPVAGVGLVAFGKGNNGGDALVAARHLARLGWTVHLVPAFPEKSWTPLVRRMLREARGCATASPEIFEDVCGTPLIVLDGLLGIGAAPGLRDAVRAVATAINTLRARSPAHVFSLDVPTGLDGDSGESDPACVLADTTLTIGCVKRGLLADRATNFVGRLRLLPLDALEAHRECVEPHEWIITPRQLNGILKRRPFDIHKGQCGRVGLIAGSPGMLGAAALSAAGALKAGAGLVTLYASADIVRELALMVPPEVMVRSLHSLAEVSLRSDDVLAIGPGLGMRHATEVQEFVASCTKPMVVDADALNCLAGMEDILRVARGPRLLTPHPGEMRRLAPDIAIHDRRTTAQRFVHRFPRATLLYKGARTIVAAPEGMAHNTTGTPGMATGGMGDVLTGVLAALLGQGINVLDAAQLGAWLCGRASEIAVDHGRESEETLTPTATLYWLGHAFAEVRSARHGAP